MHPFVPNHITSRLFPTRHFSGYRKKQRAIGGAEPGRGLAQTAKKRCVISYSVSRFRVGFRFLARQHGNPYGIPWLPNEAVEGDAQGPCEAIQGGQGRNALAVFDAGDVAPEQATPLGEIPLGECLLNPKFANS